jgi:hypothetical protein
MMVLQKFAKNSENIQMIDKKVVARKMGGLMAMFVKMLNEIVVKELKETIKIHLVNSSEKVINVLRVDNLEATPVVKVVVAIKETSKYFS